MDYLMISSMFGILETFFLVTIRILGFFLIVPIFGGEGVQARLKLFLAMTTSFILMTSQGVSYVPKTDIANAEFFVLGLKEMAVGLIMGFVVYFLMSMFYYIGQLVDFQIGFSMVSVFDPINQMQIPITGNFFYLIIGFLLIMSGAHYNFFRALFYSYMLVPIGTANLTNGTLAASLIGLFGTFFTMGFTMALPIVGSMLVLEVSLGILNKTSPQMHIFSIGMSLKVLVGLILIMVLLPMFSTISMMVFDEINEGLLVIIRGMMPQ